MEDQQSALISGRASAANHVWMSEGPRLAPPFRRTLDRLADDALAQHRQPITPQRPPLAWATMQNSMAMESIVLIRDARPAMRPAAAFASGEASTNPSTFC
jgi:hypothetical protein